MINSIQTKILETLWDNQQVNVNNILTETDKIIKNIHFKRQAGRLLTTLPRIRVRSTELEHVGELLENNEVIYLYKEWEITISTYRRGLILKF